MIARLRRLRRDDDRGFALVFVLFVTTVIMMAVTTTLTATTPNIVAAKQSQDAAAALVAAQSGIDDAIAYLVSVPECRSQTRVCPQAYGTTSASLVGTGYQRPALGAGQTFSWSLGTALTADGYVRVSSTGTSTGVSRTLVADLSLQPSILSYGYYTDYESQSPKFLNDYYGPGGGASSRSVYLSDATTYGKVSSTYRNGKSAPQTASWNAPTNTSNCGQHWYRESSSVPGRSSNGSTWTVTGTLNGVTTKPANNPVCDLVFTTGMSEDGKTYSRDALYVSYASGTGPTFNQPVYTLWGYNDGRENFTSPSSGGQPWRGNTLSSSSAYKPAVAPYDLTLPTTIGTDGLPGNSCVFFGPTRVVLNGDGTATVTSPETTTANAASDPRCYPSGTLSAGIVNFRLNYQVAGSGAIYVKNLGTAPSAGWPDNGTKLTNTPSANNEVFWLPVASTTARDASTSGAPTSGCTSSVKYSTAPAATCAWTNVATATDATSNTGWTAYTTTTKCNAGPPATDEQLFQCEYNHVTSATTPTSNAYSALRSATQTLLTSGSCATGPATNLPACLTTQLNSSLATANTGQHAYSYSTPANGDHRYSATVTAGSGALGPTQSVGAAPASPTAGDSIFTYSGSAAQEQPTVTPVTATIYRQTYSSSSKTWSAGTAQFSFTVTHTDWAITSQASGVSYFPQLADVTDYSSGTTSGAPTVAKGSAGTLQPGDLYVEGQNNGQVSLVAQNDVVVTGDITDYGTTGSDTQAVDIVAGNDVRNYHPVSCADTTSGDIDSTSAGWCPNDITNLTSASTSLQNSDGSFTAQAPQLQYANMTPTGDHTVDAAIFTLSGSFRTDNFDRAPFVGNVIVNGGIYQSHRGGNGTTLTNGSGNTAKTGLFLNYHYVDLERANLPYAPPATNSANPRPWNVVSISAGN